MSTKTIKYLWMCVAYGLAVWAILAWFNWKLIVVLFLVEWSHNIEKHWLEKP